jgi:Terminase large subunit, T4likevirus-type, N-terminal
MLLEALLIPGQLNSNPKLPSKDPNNIIYPFKEKHLWCKKATGIGVTTFMLRFMAWLCLYNDDYRDSQMVIVVGPNQELAIKLIKRMKAMFAEKLGVTFDSKEAVLDLNGCSIEAYPSNHIDAFRSLANPKFIFLDECDFIPKFQQEDVRHVSERYIAKSNPYIVMVSTPNAPGGLFERIEKEPFETCIYKKIFLDYTYGVGKIYTEEEIEKARASPSFEREYCLKYQGLVGNCFSQASIENALKMRYNPSQIIPEAKKSFGVDPAFGGDSEFAIVATQLVNGKIQVIYADSYDRPDFSDMIEEVWDLKQR